ncbi:MAG: heavy-metal-associated domain-containing protein [Crocinitomicaceae bacterium]
MKPILYLLACLSFFACKNQQENSNDKEELASTQQLIPEHNASTKISITGMTCEIGCVRTVKSHLSKMDGVIEIEMDFDTARTINYSVIQYDKNIVSENEMRTEIESIANGIYQVSDIVQQNF